jgi:hypothetical protein
MFKVSLTCRRNSSQSWSRQSISTVARAAMKCSLKVAMVHLLALTRWLCGGTVGTLDGGYLRKVPLPQVPWIQSPGHVTCSAVMEHDKHDTCYLQVPRWSDCVRSHAGFARTTRSTMLQLAPVWLM